MELLNYYFQKFVVIKNSYLIRFLKDRDNEFEYGELINFFRILGAFEQEFRLPRFVYYRCEGKGDGAFERKKAIVTGVRYLKPEKSEGDLCPKLPIYLLKRILNFIVDYYQYNKYINRVIRSRRSNASCHEFHGFLGLSLVSKEWESQLIPFLNYGIVYTKTKRHFSYYLKLITCGVYKTAIPFLSVYLTAKTVSCSVLIKEFFKVLNWSTSFKPKTLVTELTHNSKSLNIRSKETLDLLASSNHSFESIKLYSNKFELDMVVLDSATLSRNLIDLDVSNQGYKDLTRHLLPQLFTKEIPLLSLNLSDNYLRNESILELIEILKDNQLERFNISKNLSVTGKALKRLLLALNPATLRTLSVNDMKEVSKSVVKALEVLLRDSVHLVELNISNNYFQSAENLERFVESLKRSRSLQSLNLSSTSISNTLVYSEKLAEYLMQSQALTEVNLSSNAFLHNADTVIRAIAGNTVIKRVDLSFIKYTFQELVVQSLGKLFGSLERLNLKKSTSNETNTNPLSITSQLDIGIAFTIQEIDLSVNSLDENDGLRISEFLKGNQTLFKLDLSGNILGSSCTSILVSIKRHPNLRVLSLRNNGYHLTETGLLTSFLMENQVISEIDLGFNFLSDKIGQEVAVLLPYVQGDLHSLSLSGNSFEKDTGRLFQQTLRHVKIDSLNISHCAFGRPYDKTLEKAYSSQFKQFTPLNDKGFDLYLRMNRVDYDDQKSINFNKNLPEIVY